jgi:hypothetical protein
MKPLIMKFSQGKLQFHFSLNTTGWKKLTNCSACDNYPSLLPRDAKKYTSPSYSSFSFKKPRGNTYNNS